VESGEKEMEQTHDDEPSIKKKKNKKKKNKKKQAHTRGFGYST
jgi:hypothetical protein